MKRILTSLSFCFLISLGLMAQESSNPMWETVKEGSTVELNVLYHINEPFVYEEKGELMGIEIDILNYFVEWLKEKKDITLKLNYQDPYSFSALLNEVKGSSVNSIGLGSVAITDKRKESLRFSAPYLKNVSVLVSNGYVPTALSREDLKTTFSGLYPVSIKESVHADHLKELINEIGGSNSQIKEVNRPVEVIEAVQESGKYYGYTDLITFWQYLKDNQTYVKIHRIANKSDEYFGFIFPASSDWIVPFNEFMESGFGFTATKDYRKILEKHLGYEILESVELN